MNIIVKISQNNTVISQDPLTGKVLSRWQCKWIIDDLVLACPKNKIIRVNVSYRNDAKRHFYLKLDANGVFEYLREKQTRNSILHPLLNGLECEILHGKLKIENLKTGKNESHQMSDRTQYRPEGIGDSILFLTHDHHLRRFKIQPSDKSDDVAKTQMLNINELFSISKPRYVRITKWFDKYYILKYSGDLIHQNKSKLCIFFGVIDNKEFKLRTTIGFVGFKCVAFLNGAFECMDNPKKVKKFYFNNDLTISSIPTSAYEDVKVDADSNGLLIGDYQSLIKVLINDYLPPVLQDIVCQYLIKVDFPVNLASHIISADAQNNI